MQRLAVLAGILLSLSAATASAEYPDRVVRIIVPLAAGGGADIITRIVADKLSEKLGQQFIVENRTGGGTTIGTKAVVAAPPDGYTLLMGQSSLAITTALNKNLGYDVTKDLTPIVNVVVGPNALMVNPKVPAKSLKEFIAFAKAAPDGVVFSSAGTGTPSHLGAELFRSMTGIKIVHVPARGMNPAILDVVAGNVQAVFAGLPAAISEARAGHVRLIAVSEKKRASLSPEVPTIAEAGLPGYDISNWTGLLGPAGLDRAIVEKLNTAVIAILNDPAMKARLEKIGFEQVDGTPEEFARQLKHDVDRWSALVRSAGIHTN
jgi:tripartite-type tricarboxylate transporter receptor subunit TctC